jgi:methylated-DNA-[protein]-cysteine S-methyltransferase
MNMPESPLWGVAKTSMGWVGLRAGPKGISRVILPQRSEALTSRALASDNGDSDCRDQDALAPWLEALVAMLSGERVEFGDWPLDMSGATPFRRRVWRTVRRIPWGQSRTYWWVAVRIGDPRAARAIGQAMGANPLPLVVPCHRVIRTGGGLGGFGGGLEMKRRLLTLEGNEEFL